MVGQQVSCLGRNAFIQAESANTVTLYIVGAGCYVVERGRIHGFTDRQREDSGTSAPSLSASEDGGRNGAQEKSGTEKEESGEEGRAEN